MDHLKPKERHITQIIAYIILGTLLFAIAYSQSPLFTSNQNQYFLHGLAQAGLGTLRGDWLANTLDPTPVFSVLVEATYRYIHFLPIFYLYYAILMGIYLFSLFGIADYLFDLRSSRTKTLLFLAMFILIHSAGLRFAISLAFGTNWSYLLEDGMADQRILGPVLQPSSFGVLFILSICLFLKSRPYIATITAVLAAIVHPTYLLTAAVLILAYITVILLESRRLKQPLLIGIIALILVTPIAAYVLVSFGSPTTDITEKARQILVEYRIPDHAVVSQWLDATALVKLILVMIGIYLVRAKRIFVILLLASAIAILLTLLQVITNSFTLALLFPWRLSVVIVPVSVTIILAFLVTHLLDRPGLQNPKSKKWLQIASGLIISFSVLIGAFRFVLDLQRKVNEPERAVEDYIYAQHLPGEIYLTPIKLQDFRLNSGAPAYIDFKSIPYKDTDVLEWYHRVRLAERFYKNLDCSLLASLIEEGHVTHVIIEADQPELKCLPNAEIYRDNSFVVYRLSSP